MAMEVDPRMGDVAKEVTTIAIVDYGMGNFHSVARALKFAAPDADIRICNQPQDIDAADRVVFPGQGAMADCMRTLNESGLREAVVRAARNKPRRGVCVGEQMLFDAADEGGTSCLGLFPGVVRRFSGPRFADRIAADAEACLADTGAAGASARRALTLSGTAFRTIRTSISSKVTTPTRTIPA
ncbi:hypothetical protein G6F59_015553 [Rhizopus arrhizus]|nr:hypothetical protein G6F59_015553 [Rhizopus arrhizus]